MDAMQQQQRSTTTPDFYQTKHKTTNDVFLQHVWPIISSSAVPANSQVINCELSKDRATKLLDRTQCCDFLVITTGSIELQLAVRTQPIDPGSTPWNTFTLRYTKPEGCRVEADKLIARYLNGTLSNHISIQAYYDRDSLDPLTIAQISTKELIGWFLEHKDSLRKRTNWQDGTEFYAVPWYRLASQNSFIQLL